jgi:hypothetical protein
MTSEYRENELKVIAGLSQQADAIDELVRGLRKTAQHWEDLAVRVRELVEMKRRGVTV